MLSVFGSTGFIGSNWMRIFSSVSYAEPRESVAPKYDELLYFRSTNSNYNVFQDVTLDVKTNLLLFTQTLQNIRPQNIFNHISSWFVCYPKGFYSATKLCQENLLESFGKTFGIKYRIIRPCNVVGGDNNCSKKKNALEWIILLLKKNEDVNVYEGSNIRNFIHVEDFCNATKLILDNGDFDTIFEVGGLEDCDLIDAVEYCKKTINSKSKIRRVPTPKFHSTVQIKDYHSDISNLIKLKFKYQYPSIESLLNKLCQK